MRFPGRPRSRKPFRHAWSLGQSRAPLVGPRCFNRSPTVLSESNDACFAAHLHVLHVLPFRDLGEYVEEEIVEVATPGEFVIVKQGLLAVVFRFDAVLGLVCLEVEQICCTTRENVTSHINMVNNMLINLVGSTTDRGCYISTHDRYITG